MLSLTDVIQIIDGGMVTMPDGRQYRIIKGDLINVPARPKFKGTVQVGRTGAGDAFSRFHEAVLDADVLLVTAGLRWVTRLIGGTWWRR